MQEEVAISERKSKALGLTPREAGILGWVAQGKTNSEVAVLCDISERTVQKHLEHIYEKLGVETRTAAARLALLAKVE
jgi:DNA-binding CsgD family transcriptional regulator